MAKGPDWNDEHRTNPGAIRDAMIEPDISFDDPQEKYNGNGYDPKGEPSPARFQLVPFDGIQLDSTPPYLVKGLIPRTGLTVIWGPPKCGKSFWTFDLAMHIALGWEYRGRRVMQGAVVYCALEGAHGFRARVEAFRQAKITDGAANVPFFLISRPMTLAADHGFLIVAIRATLGATAPAAVVINTLNRSISGSESDDRDMAAYIQAADAVRDAFDCAVIVVHHCGHEGSRPRGHSSLLGAVDALISVKRDAANNIAVTVEFMKDGAASDEIVSRLEPIEVGVDTDGELITSCVVAPVEDVTAQATAPTHFYKKCSFVPPPVPVPLVLRGL
jgi:AAA domain